MFSSINFHQTITCAACGGSKETVYGRDERADLAALRAPLCPACQVLDVSFNIKSLIPKAPPHRVTAVHLARHMKRWMRRSMN